jgi:hypothetical protein
LTNSVEFLKKEKISMKKILDKVFIHLYSFYWKKITSNEERLLIMNKSFQESYEDYETEKINFYDDNGKFEEYKNIVNVFLK